MVESAEPFPTSGRADRRGPRDRHRGIASTPDSLVPPALPPRTIGARPFPSRAEIGMGPTGRPTTDAFRFPGRECKAAGEDRTPGLLITNQLLYRLSYSGATNCTGGPREKPLGTSGDQSSHSCVGWAESP